MEKDFSKMVVVLASSVLCFSTLAVAAEATKEVSTRVKPQTLKMSPLMATPASPVEKSDLIPQTISIISGQAKAGSPVIFEILVWNMGKIRSPRTAVNVSLRKGTIGTQNPLAFSKDIELGAIDPGRAKVAQFKKTFKGSSAGFWVIRARVDPKKKIFESNEQNNVAEQGFRVYK